MEKEKIKEILEYYIREDITYLYYENNMYPTRVSRPDLINRITHKLYDNEEKREDCPLCEIRSSGDKVPNREKLQEMFRDFFIYHNSANKNTGGVDEYFNEWFDACTANGHFIMGLTKKIG